MVHTLASVLAHVRQAIVDVDFTVKALKAADAGAVVVAAILIAGGVVGAHVAVRLTRTLVALTVGALEALLTQASVSVGSFLVVDARRVVDALVLF